MPPPALLVLLALICAVIGLAVGATGYGGFLVPVALVGLLQMAAPVAVYHGLLGAVLATVLAGALHLRSGRGAPQWPLVGWLSLGTLPGVAAGRWLTTVAEPSVLQMLLGTVVLAAAVLMLLPRRTDAGADAAQFPSNRHRAVVPAAAIVAGCLGGLATMFAGVGGPLVTIPALLAVGVPLSTAIGAAIANSLLGILAALATMVGHLPTDPGVLVIVTLAMAVGATAGALLHRRTSTTRLVRPVAVVSVASGLWLTITAVAALIGPGPGS